MTADVGNGSRRSSYSRARLPLSIWTRRNGLPPDTQHFVESSQRPIFTMPIDFHLSPAEQETRAAAAAFAQSVLKQSRAAYEGQTGHAKRFQATRPAYEAAAAGGLIKGLVAGPLGGSGGSLVESAIMVEECYAVEPSAALTLFATGLGLSPLNALLSAEGAGEGGREFLAPFLSGQGAPLASLAFSEPGGVANWLEKGGRGLNTTARRQPDGSWALNGEKMWATNCAGWDFKGADLTCVVCRDASAEGVADDPRSKIMLLVVTRADLDRSGPGAFTVLRHVETAGHTSWSGPHVRYTDVVVPAGNLLCAASPSGRAADAVLGAFDGSAVLVGAMGVGLMRAAFDAALAFARGWGNGGGAEPLLARQAAADLLSGVKMQAEACRALTWKAAHALERGPGSYAARRELALAAKVHCSDAAVRAVVDAMGAVGVSSYDKSQPFASLLMDAMALPVFDGGNVGMRRRDLQQLMMDPEYDAWAATYGPSK
ncbi:hypothetical protein GGTG_09104 [Gaeumannomyces tritici R3-111a-1]|uniref:Acyl-CoA dehydrogenase n=1 Tax=Gaeumannomyces tritici (strain R3-111a-1) TaxID=644352 RepID=J3P6G4_GAET3|nr:hypothetical protein GGTG_09104 [Gaeumannomyces tritici R3-111a-1]EJT72238.1 hypothetical protein GGTG_09104 [Gaeumannomyces tritici R3-111a-1]